LPGIGTRGIAAAIARVDLLVGVHQQDYHGEIVIELEEAEIDGIDARQADADEFIGNVANAFQTDNLPVKLFAVHSGDAAQDNHQWLARFLRL
jgi:hypothetical protein